ncbi:MAG: hypothetical protein OSJ27_08875 [Candidatus Gastranaerophilales bacterium]|nr:hypothetical protein [Candidatus Gastranaerophilales bacterium]
MVKRSETDIVNEIEALEAELPRRKKIASLLEHEGFKLAVEELTGDCVQNVKAKKYKSGKTQIKSLECIEDFEKYLLTQNERADSIEAKLDKCKFELAYNQLNLLDNPENPNDSDKGGK